MICSIRLILALLLRHPSPFVNSSQGIRHRTEGWIGTKLGRLCVHRTSVSRVLPFLQRPINTHITEDMDVIKGRWGGAFRRSLQREIVGIL